jgi:parallel beta-helix repeat protein
VAWGANSGAGIGDGARNDSYAGQHGWALYGCTGCTISGNTVALIYGSFVKLAADGGTDPCDDITISGNTFDSNGQHGIVCDGAANVTVESNTVRNVRRAMFSFAPSTADAYGDSWEITGNTFGAHVEEFIVANAGAGAAALDNIDVHDNVVSTPAPFTGPMHCWFVDWRPPQPTSPRRNNFRFVDNVTSGQAGTVGADGNWVMQIEETDGVTVTGNTQPMQAGADMYLVYWEDCTAVNVSGNVLVNGSGQVHPNSGGGGPAAPTIDPGVDQTGTSDVTAAIQSHINVTSGVVRLQPDAIYRVEGTLQIVNRTDWTLDLNGATIKATDPVPVGLETTVDAASNNTPTSSTVLHVASVSGFPNAGTIIVVGTIIPNSCTVLSYSGRDTVLNRFTGVDRADNSDNGVLLTGQRVVLPHNPGDRHRQQIHIIDGANVTVMNGFVQGANVITSENNSKAYCAPLEGQANIAVENTQNVVLRDLVCSKAHGDGFYFAKHDPDDLPVSGLMERVTLTSAGRMGLVPNGVDGFEIRNCDFQHIRRSMFDFEPNNQTDCCINLWCHNNFYDNIHLDWFGAAGGFGAGAPFQNILFEDELGGGFGATLRDPGKQNTITMTAGSADMNWVETPGSNPFMPEYLGADVEGFRVYDISGLNRFIGNALVKVHVVNAILAQLQNLDGTPYPALASGTGQVLYRARRGPFTFRRCTAQQQTNASPCLKLNNFDGVTITDNVYPLSIGSPALVDCDDCTAITVTGNDLSPESSNPSDQVLIR